MNRIFPPRAFRRSLGLLVLYELRRNLRSFRFLFSGVLLLILVGAAVWTGFADYRLRSETYLEELAAESLELSKTRVYSYLQPVVSKPPDPLSIFERGVEGLEGTRFRIHLFEIPDLAAEPTRGNPYLARLVGFDVTLVVKLVLGLGVLLLTFDSAVGARSLEREEVMAAHGCSLLEILSAKVLAVLGAVMTALVFSLLLPVGVLVYFEVLPLELEVGARLVGLVTAYVLYGLAMALVGLLISLASSTVGRSLVYSTLTWLILVVLLPMGLTAGFTAWGDLRYDPSEVERQIRRLDADRRSSLADVWGADPVRRDVSGHIAISTSLEGDGRVLRRLGSKRFYESLASFYAEEVRWGKLIAERSFLLRSREKERLRRLMSPLAWFAAFSPGQMLDLVAASVAGTSRRDYDRFVESAQRYRLRFLAFLEKKDAFRSWRWFTDDPAETRPWTSFLGLRPEEVGPEELDAAIRRLGAPEIKAAIEAVLTRQDAGPGVDLTDLPIFEPETAGVVDSLGFLVAFSAMIVVLCLLVLDVADRRARGTARGEVQALSRSETSRAGRSRSPTRAAESMFRAELSAVTSGLRWRAGAAVVVVTLVTGATVFLPRARALEEDQRKIEAAYEERLHDASLDHVVGIDHLALRPAWPLGFLVDGNERVLPSTYRFPLSVWGRPVLESSDVDERRLSTVPIPDGSFVLRVVLSLVVFFLAYDSFCGTRLARCRIQWASGASIARIVWIRGAALWVASVVPFLVGGLSGLGLLALLGALDLGAGEWIKLTSFAVVGLWAIAVYVLTAMGISALLGRAEESLVTLVLLWVTAVAVVPSGAGVLAMSLRPLPTDREVQEALDAVEERAAGQDVGGFRPRDLARADGFALERKAANYQRRRKQEELAVLRSVVRGQLAQAELASRLGYASPTGLLQDMLERLLGSGIYRQRAFIEQAETFEAHLERWALDGNARDPNSPRLGLLPRYFSRMPADLETLPRFAMEEPGPAESRVSALVPGAIFLLMTAFLAAVLPALASHRLSTDKGTFL